MFLIIVIWSQYMSLKKNIRESNKQFVYKHIWQCSKGLNGIYKFSVKYLADILGVSSASVLRYIDALIDEEKIRKVERNGYEIIDKEYIFEHSFPFQSEDYVWNNDIIGLIPNSYPQNAIINMNYVFTEIFNNAIEHSEGNKIKVGMYVNDFEIKFEIVDNGVGIFEKIKRKAGLEEKRYAILELAKGKFTTEPKSHTGEGIFFSSKIADEFFVASDGLMFAGDDKDADNILFDSKLIQLGTLVAFSIKKQTRKIVNKVFADFCDNPDSFGFEKTIVAVRLLEEGSDCPMITSRSQAKRLMARLDRFKTTMLDFSGIKTIGQGFADEIFRVFANSHKTSKIIPVNANKMITNMIEHVRQNDNLL